MAAAEIESLIKSAIPDADVTIADLAGDGDHYCASVVSRSFRGPRAFSSIRRFMLRSAAEWAGNCTRCS
jgi:acid stress-induced BolA-like protein IbaG/YrbA